MAGKVVCHYPGCKQEGFYSFALKLTNERDSQVELPFCQYHNIIVMGGHFKAKMIKHPVDGRLDEFEMKGPFKEVEIAQQVNAAIQMTSKPQSDNKNLNKPKG